MVRILIAPPRVSQALSMREYQFLAPPSAAQLADLSTIPGLGFVAEATNFRSALIQQFNLQVEQQFGSNVFTIGYVGNIAQHLPESINNINQPAALRPHGSARYGSNPGAMLHVR